MILLINPHIASEERYGKKIADIGGHQMPLGIFYLASYLLQRNISTHIIDAEMEGWCHEDVVAQITKLSPKLVGITATTVGFKNAHRLAQLIRQQHPDITLVIGGPHMTAMPMLTMKTQSFDFGITNEGEIPLYQLIQFLFFQQGRLEDINNLYFYHQGEIKKNKGGWIVEDLDQLPFPARHLSPDIRRYRPPIGAFLKIPVINLITSRGCPYLCIFCDNNTFGRKTRFFSAEYVVNEIKEVMAKYQAAEIAFLDDTFILDKKRLYRIFELLDQEKISFPWTCMSRVNNLDYQTLKFLKEHGLWQLRIGVESGNADVLKFIKKGITLEQVKNVTRWARELGIRTTGFFIIGHHTDTKETIQQTIDFATSIPLNDAIFTINTPIPGTESYLLASKYGCFDEQDWTAFNYWTPIFVPQGLTKEDLIRAQAQAYRRFYFRWGPIYDRLKRIRSWAECSALLKNAFWGLKFIRQS